MSQRIYDYRVAACGFFCKCFFRHGFTLIYTDFRLHWCGVAWMRLSKKSFFEVFRLYYLTHGSEA